MYLPSDSEIREKATELGILSEDGSLSSTDRANVVNLLLEHQARAKTREVRGDASTLIHSARIKVADGYLVIEVRHIPNTEVDPVTRRSA